MNKKIYKLISSTKQGLIASAMILFSVSTYAQATYSFSYTGAMQTLNVAGGDYLIECWGADGGDGGGTAPPLTGLGGKGGYSKGVYFASASTLYIYVGEKGKSNDAAGTVMVTAPGGFNGGGGGFNGTSGNYFKGGGGGASHVASAPGLLSTLSSNQTAVAIVAGAGGGGGGAGSVGYTGTGGNGGGLLGMDGILAGSQTTHNGKGGTQTAGGAGGVYGGTSMGVNGSFGQGGDGGSIAGNVFPAGGGGGGWYGGGGGATQGGSGGGGSSYIGGVNNGITIGFGQPGFVPNPDPNGNGYVIITRLCDVNVTASKNPICEGESITLTTNAGSNIQWNTGPTTSSIIVSPTTTTSYTVSGVSSSTSACSSTVSIVVKVNPLPVIAFETFPTVFCAGASGSVFATGAVTYTWSNSTTGSSTLVNPLMSTVYTATGTSVHGCKKSETVMVTVNTNSLSVTSNTTICKGSSANLTASGVNTALWSNGAYFLNIQVSPSTNTVYSVNGVDAMGCTLSNTVSVNVLDLPVIGITSSKQTVCRGESVTLTASGGANYLWNNTQTTSSITETLTVNVPYQFSVIGTDANNCSSTAMITVNASACTGLNENGLVQVSIFPNPVNNEITVAGMTATKKIIVISDVLGKTLLVTESNALSLNMNVENLPAGVYNIQVTEGDNTTVQKFIKL